MSKKKKGQAAGNVKNGRMIYVEKEPNLLGAVFLALIKGDIGVKLSAIFMGAGYLFRKQFIKAILMTVYQVAMLWFIISTAITYMPQFASLGTVQMEYVFNMQTMKNEVNDYDNSFTILLMNVITIVAIIVFLASWLLNLRAVHNLQKLADSGKHVNNFYEDIKSYINEKFHITLLSLPVAGVVIFTIVPLFILIAVAFTNYDQLHMPPTTLFDWVGITNFKTLFSTGLSATFGYSFRKILVWTLIWAFFATFSNYFLGIMFAKFLLNKKTKFPKFWRTIFVVTIAVPQFVTLLIIRNFLADQGIMNTMMANAGVTDMLKFLGLIPGSLNYIPFLSDPIWTKVMVIIVNIWVGVPYQMLVATGVLLNIPADMTESAKIDGANAWQSFWKITMPYMFAVTGPTLVTDFVRNINNFNVIYLLTQDVYFTTDQALATSRAKEIDLLVTWLFRLTQEGYNYKMASVIGIMVFIICAIFTLVAFRFLTSGDKESEFQ